MCLSDVGLCFDVGVRPVAVFALAFVPGCATDSQLNLFLAYCLCRRLPISACCHRMSVDADWFCCACAGSFGSAPLRARSPSTTRARSNTALGTQHLVLCLWFVAFNFYRSLLDRV